MTDGTAHVEGVVSAAEQAGGLLAGAVREEGLADLCGDEQRYLLSCNHAVPKPEKPIVCKDGLEDKSNKVRGVLLVPFFFKTGHACTNWKRSRRRWAEWKREGGGIARDSGAARSLR